MVKHWTGAPQGSILGPRLFNIFVCDLLLILGNSYFASHEDDNTPHTINQNTNSVTKLLERLSVWLLSWFKESKLNLNLDKCHLIVSGTENAKIKLDYVTITNSKKEKLLAIKNIINSGADPGFVLLSKWQSRISFLWNVKQAKKRFRGVLIQSRNLCIFPRGLWCTKFSVIFPVNLLFWSMLFEGDCRSVKVFRLEFLTLKHPISEHLPKFILKKLVW